MDNKTTIKKLMQTSDISDDKKKSLAMLAALGSQPANAQSNSMVMSLLESLMQPETNEDDQFKQIFIERELQNESPDYATIMDLMEGKTTARDVLNKTGTSKVEQALKDAQDAALSEMGTNQEYDKMRDVANLTPEQYGEYSKIDANVWDVIQRGFKDPKVGAANAGVLLSPLVALGYYGTAPSRIKEERQKDYIKSLPVK